MGFPLKEEQALRPKILAGWKSIARYLSMGVRTVQRYERCHGLPIRRPAGGASGAVVATIAELDAWMEASPLRYAFKLQTPESKETEASMKALKLNMAEMQRLRSEMRGLREEVRISLHRLQANIRGVGPEKAPRLTPSEFIEAKKRSRLKQPSNVLYFDSKAKIVD
jgi:hypothetical protein